MKREAENILQQVCGLLGMDLETVKSGSREKHDVEARYIAVMIAYNLWFPAYSLKEIGSWFFPLNSDSAHSMVIHAKNKVAEWKMTRRGFEDKLRSCEAVCGEMNFDVIPQL